LFLTTKVSLIYRDKSLGNSVQVAVVKMHFLEESETFSQEKVYEDSSISASNVLKSFCRWQAAFKEYLKEDEKYDVALLLTRYKKSNMGQDHKFVQK
jgi:hypothetical protein